MRITSGSFQHGRSLTLYMWFRYCITNRTIWFTLGIKFLKKLKSLSPLAHYMGKYVKKAAHFHKNMLTLASSDALIEKFDELMLIWQRFDTL